MWNHYHKQIFPEYRSNSRGNSFQFDCAINTGGGICVDDTSILTNDCKLEGRNSNNAAPELPTKLAASHAIVDGSKKHRWREEVGIKQPPRL